MPALSRLRLHHLLLGIAAIAAYLLGEEDNGLHRLLGYTVAGLLIIRLLLALANVQPFGWRRLVPRLSAGPGQQGMRHPIISRLMTLAILVTVAGAATTGVMMDRGATLATVAAGQMPVGEEEGEARGGHDDRGEHEDRRGGEGEEHGEEHGEEGVLGELHELFANLMLPLVGIHILYLLLFRRSMALFMLFWPQRRAAARS